MKPIVVLRNDAGVPPGYLADALGRADRPWRLVHLDDGAELPAVDAVAGVVALGGLMGAYEEELFPYLADEKRFLAAAVDADVPVLGICLGAQLLADALGGKAYLAEAPEAEFAPVELTSAGASDPVTATLADRSVLRLHQDTWDLPAGATSLASGGMFEQGFRLGSAIGIQPHPEAGPEIVAQWLRAEGVRTMCRMGGSDPDAIVAAVTESRADGEETAARFFDAWVAEC